MVKKFIFKIILAIMFLSNISCFSQTNMDMRLSEHNDTIRSEVKKIWYLEK